MISSAGGNNTQENQKNQQTKENEEKNDRKNTYPFEENVCSVHKTDAPKEQISSRNIVKRYFKNFFTSIYHV